MKRINITQETIADSIKYFFDELKKIIPAKANIVNRIILKEDDNYLDEILINDEKRKVK